MGSRDQAVDRDPVVVIGPPWLLGTSPALRVGRRIVRLPQLFANAPKR